jgi:SSS family solute:Na+ symporter
MTGSDANAISSVVTRDILPAIWKRGGPADTRTELVIGRITVSAFIALSMLIALTADSFGGVLGLVILWFGGLVGPIAIPMLLGMLPAFKRCGPTAAIASWAVGLVVFALTRYVVDDWIAQLAPDQATAVSVGGPVICSIITFVLVGLVRPWRDDQADALVDAISEEIDESTVFGDAASTPAPRAHQTVRADDV